MVLAGVPTGVIMAVAELDGNAGSLIRPLLRAAPLERAGPFERRVINSGTGFLRTAPMGYLRPAENRRAASHRHSVQANTSLNASRFLRAASAEAVPKGRTLKQMCSSTAVDNTGEELRPKVPSRWAKVLALLIQLTKGSIFKLLLLCLSVWIGVLAVKQYPIATDIVDVCDKGHKVYNILSKGFLIIAEILKGDNK